MLRGEGVEREFEGDETVINESGKTLGDESSRTPINESGKTMGNESGRTLDNER